MLPTSLNNAFPNSKAAFSCSGIGSFSTFNNFSCISILVPKLHTPKVIFFSFKETSNCLAQYSWEIFNFCVTFDIRTYIFFPLNVRV